MQDVQRRQPSLLEAPVLELVEFVRPDVSQVLVLAPVVLLRQPTTGQALFSSLLPELALGFAGEGDAVVGDGAQQVGVGVRLLLGGRQGREADFLVALVEDSRLVVALLGSLADGLGSRFGSRFGSGCRSK